MASNITEELNGEKKIFYKKLSVLLTRDLKIGAGEETND